MPVQPHPVLPIRVPRGFRIIAHRGASAYAPENTLPAFTLAQAMGVPEVELDVQLSTDGEVVLCHDTTLARYGHGDRVVEELAWADLAALDMGAWFSPHHFGGTPMLTLPALLDAFGAGFTYHIELKGHAPTLPAAVQRVVAERGLFDQVLITSFSYTALELMRALNPSVRLGWLVGVLDAGTLAQAQALGLYQLCPEAKSVTAAQVVAAREVVTEVRAWGLNSPHTATQPADVQELIRRTLDAGCDGFTINWPDWVKVED